MFSNKNAQWSFAASLSKEKKEHAVHCSARQSMKKDIARVANGELDKTSGYKGKSDEWNGSYARGYTGPRKHPALTHPKGGGDRDDGPAQQQGQRSEKEEPPLAEASGHGQRDEASGQHTREDDAGDPGHIGLGECRRAGTRSRRQQLRNGGLRPARDVAHRHPVQTGCNVKAREFSKVHPR